MFSLQTTIYLKKDVLNNITWCHLKWFILEFPTDINVLKRGYALNVNKATS